MATTNFLLDTNIASHIIKGDVPAVRARVMAVPMHQVSISAVTQAELLYGVAKRGHPAGLAARVREFLARVTVQPWAAAEAECYGLMRAQCEAHGVPMGSLDMMIAAHAWSLQKAEQQAGDRSILVTRDSAFSRIPISLSIEDWASTD
jgi:tRNA(fMet)-specific endonuclease VapC